ncbi:MAG: methionyl-tRNA formyltransferase [Chromatiaceae bacterium]|nr:methionyl-tRNA formyltransferase [Chromatiaceae bacterium]MCP5315948.1 methionyl-tRNA formyltransferase [Chromatiaceae bacterium]
MKLVLCVKRDLHGCMFLNQLLPQLAGHELHVLLSDKTRPAEQQIPALRELAYLERSLPCDRLFPLLDRQLVSGEWATFAGLEERYDVALEVVEDVNAPSLVDRLAAFAPDLIVSARFSHIFQPQVIAIARHGAVNIHPGELPVYAGLFAPMRTIAEGGGTLVSCMHFIDGGIDTGPVIATRHLPFRTDEGLLEQIAELYVLAIPLLLDLIARLGRDEEIPSIPQDVSRRRYRSMPDANEVEAFLAAGHRFWKPRSYDALLARFVPATPPAADADARLAIIETIRSGEDLQAFSFEDES